MARPHFAVGRATQGLVLALFLACAIFLVVLLIQILGEAKDRQGLTGAESAHAAGTIEQLLPEPGTFTRTSAARADVLIHGVTG